jgi:hypothetical protein
MSHKLVQQENSYINDWIFLSVYCTSQGHSSLYTNAARKDDWYVDCLLFMHKKNTFGGKSPRSRCDVMVLGQFVPGRQLVPGQFVPRTIRTRTIRTYRTLMQSFWYENGRRVIKFSPQLMRWVIVSPLVVHGRVIPGKFHYICVDVNPPMYKTVALKMICLVILSYPRHNFELLIDMKRYLFTNECYQWGDGCWYYTNCRP